MTETRTLTTRLRPDVDRRLRATAALRRARLSQVVNEALDQALPTLPEVSLMMTGPNPGQEASVDRRR